MIDTALSAVFLSFFRTSLLRLLHILCYFPSSVFFIIAPVPIFGRAYFESLAIADDATPTAAFTLHDDCDAAALRSQLGYTHRDLNDDEAHQSLILAWANLLADLTRATTTSSFLTAADRYDVVVHGHRWYDSSRPFLKNKRSLVTSSSFGSGGPTLYSVSRLWSAR
jgi:hypothetical protein